MVSEQMTTVLALLGCGTDASQTAAVQAATVLGVDGVTAGAGVGPEGAVLAWGAEPVGVGLEDQQFTLGEGPGLDAVATGVPVLIPDLARAGDRWPAFGPAATALGVAAVFAFPLRIGAISVGALLAHRAAPGPLAGPQMTDALALSGAVTMLLLDRSGAVPGAAEPPPDWAAPVTYRAGVHQATGMISIQMGVELAEALVRLRAHAWAGGRLLDDVAADVVARRLRFDDPNL